MNTSTLLQIFILNLQILTEIFETTLNLTNHQQYLCLSIFQNILQKSITKCRHIDHAKHSDTESDFISKAKEMTTYGLQHKCNIQHSSQPDTYSQAQIDCFPLNEDSEVHNQFINNSLRTPRTIKTLNALISNSLGSKRVISVSGSKHVCAILEVGSGLIKQLKLFCWGNNANNQCDIPAAVNDQLYDFHTIDDEHIQLKAQGERTCISIQGSSTQCWGESEQSNELFADILELGNSNTLCIKKHRSHLDIFEFEIECLSDNPSMTTIPVESQKKNESLSIGTNHVCTQIRTDNLLSCWGTDTHGQTSVPQTFQKYSVTQVASDEFTCAAKANALVTCWGKVISNQNNYSNNNLEDSMKRIYFNVSTIVSAGGTHTCGNLDGDLKCFGSNFSYQLQIPVTQAQDSIQVQSGWDFSCSLNDKIQVDCWGQSRLGQTDMPDLINKHVSEISSGLNRTCAKYHSESYLVNNIVCWGGHSEFDENTIPEMYQGKIWQISTGDQHTCFIQQLNNHISFPQCIGKNLQNQCDTPATLQDPEYANFHRQKQRQISAGDEHTCIIYSSDNIGLKHSLKCWGFNSHGQVNVPTNLNGGENSTFAFVSTGDCHTCVIVSNISSLQCWGLRFEHNHQPIPDKQPMQIAVGNDYDCVLDGSWDIQCWGENEFGQCDVPKQQNLLE